MFQFRLEPVLRLRVAERDARRAELAQALEAEQVVQAQARDLKAELAQMRQLTTTACQPGTVNVDRLLNSHRYELLLQVQLDQLRQRSVQVRAEIERRRERLVEADRDVRVLEQLRDRQAAEAAREVLRSEQKQLDEIALRRHARVAPE